MRYPFKKSCGGLCCLVLAAVLTSNCRGSRSAPPSVAGPPEVKVVTVRPQRVAVTTELAGRTSAFLLAEVRPQVTGIIREQLFAEGSDVKAGDVLYRIDPATYQTALDGARATLAKAQAAKDSAQAAAVKAQAARANAQAARETLTANRASAEAALARAEAAGSPRD